MLACVVCLNCHGRTSGRSYGYLLTEETIGLGNYCASVKLRFCSDLLISLLYMQDWYCTARLWELQVMMTPTSLEDAKLQELWIFSPTYSWLIPLYQTSRSCIFLGSPSRDWHLMLATGPAQRFNSCVAVSWDSLET